MNKLQIGLYNDILQRIKHRGDSVESVLAKHAPTEKRHILISGFDKDRSYSILSSFVSKISVSEKDKCWNWTGYCGPYGQAYVMRKIVRSHVLMKDLWDGLPDTYGGKSSGCNAVRHSCDNPSCCNPNHLLNGTISDNINDALFRNRKSMKPLIESSRKRWASGLAIRDPKSGRIIRWARENVIDALLPIIHAGDPNLPDEDLP